MLQTLRVEHGRGGKGVYGRAMGTVRSKAEPWNEWRVFTVPKVTPSRYLNLLSPGALRFLA